MLSLRSHSLLSRDRDLVVHSYQVMSATDQLLLRMEDAETAQRGFVITGDPAFLGALLDCSARCDSTGAQTSSGSIG